MPQCMRGDMLHTLTRTDTIVNFELLIISLNSSFFQGRKIQHRLLMTSELCQHRVKSINTVK